MAKLTWDDTGKRYFESGVDHGVLYPFSEGAYQTGVAWNGLTAVSETPEGADATDFWADNIKYATMRAAESFGGTIEAYTYPTEFEACDGTATLVKGVTVGQQTRQAFGFCYRTTESNDQAEENYKIHIWYGCTASPSERSYETINDSPDAITFSWEVTTNPVPVAGFKPTSLLVLNAREVGAAGMAAVEKMPSEIKEAIEGAAG